MECKKKSDLTGDSIVKAFQEQWKTVRINAPLPKVCTRGSAPVSQSQLDQISKIESGQRTRILAMLDQGLKPDDAMVVAMELPRLLTPQDIIKLISHGADVTRYWRNQHSVFHHMGYWRNQHSVFYHMLGAPYCEYVHEILRTCPVSEIDMNAFRHLDTNPFCYPLSNCSLPLHEICMRTIRGFTSLQYDQTSDDHMILKCMQENHDMLKARYMAFNQFRASATTAIKTQFSTFVVVLVDVIIDYTFWPMPKITD